MTANAGQVVAKEKQLFTIDEWTEWVKYYGNQCERF